eukprot:9477274-Pyramimonas_sp.AAC.1
MPVRRYTSVTLMPVRSGRKGGERKRASVYPTGIAAIGVSDGYLSGDWCMSRTKVEWTEHDTWQPPPPPPS